MRGYKVFNPDWTCRGFKFEVGKTFTEDVIPVCCDRGFHFCTKATDCFNYYGFNPDNKVAEVEALGDIDTNNNDSKCSTNKIHIIREIAWPEVLDLVNLGKACTGFSNRGNYNSGNCNNGSYNNGNYNSGFCNRGDGNNGNYNNGNYNSGNCNSGNRNSGGYNSGNGNSGDWNKTYFSNGCFNTESPQIFLFNKLSDWTYQDWLNSKAKEVLRMCPCNILKWRTCENMTDKEKKNHSECSVTGGFLEYIENETKRQMWWNKLSDIDKDAVMSLPNFDKDIFKEITGIDVDEK